MLISTLLSVCSNTCLIVVIHSIGIQHFAVKMFHYTAYNVNLYSNTDSLTNITTLMEDDENGQTFLLFLSIYSQWNRNDWDIIMYSNKCHLYWVSVQTRCYII